MTEKIRPTISRVQKNLSGSSLLPARAVGWSLVRKSRTRRTAPSRPQDRRPGPSHSL